MARKKTKNNNILWVVGIVLAIYIINQDGLGPQAVIPCQINPGITESVVVEMVTNQQDTSFVLEPSKIHWRLRENTVSGTLEDEGDWTLTQAEKDKLLIALNNPPTGSKTVASDGKSLPIPTAAGYYYFEGEVQTAAGQRVIEIDLDYIRNSYCGFPYSNTFQVIETGQCGADYYVSESISISNGVITVTIFVDVGTNYPSCTETRSDSSFLVSCDSGYTPTQNGRDSTCDLIPSCNPPCPYPSTVTCGQSISPYEGCMGPCQAGTQCPTGETCQGGTCVSGTVTCTSLGGVIKSNSCSVFSSTQINGATDVDYINTFCCTICVDTTWSPDPSTVCVGDFTQTSNCGNTRTAQGTKTTGCLICNNCKPNACSTYTDCTADTSGTCSSGNCCTGTCTVSTCVESQCSAYTWTNSTGQCGTGTRTCPSGSTCSLTTTKSCVTPPDVIDDAYCLALNEPLNNGKYFADDDNKKCITECAPWEEWSKSDKECGINWGIIILGVALIFGIKMMRDK